jgi:hypothetical protein
MYERACLNFIPTRQGVFSLGLFFFHPSLREKGLKTLRPFFLYGFFEMWQAMRRVIRGKLALF